MGFNPEVNVLLVLSSVEQTKMACLHVPFRLLAMCLFILAMLTSMVLSEDVPADPNDIHGGVTMGVSNVRCDDGKVTSQCRNVLHLKKKCVCVPFKPVCHMAYIMDMSINQYCDV